MNTDIDYGLSPFASMSKNTQAPRDTFSEEALESELRRFEDAIEEKRRIYHNPNTSDEERDKIWDSMWKLYVGTKFPHISKVHQDAAWVDRNGNIATLYNENGEAFPLTKENWFKITRHYANPISRDREAFKRLTAYLHDNGFAHLDEIPQDTPSNERGSDFRMYSQPELIPPFTYGDYENYETPKLIPNREIYDDSEFTI